MDEVSVLIEKYKGKLREDRIWLHRHPECSGEEKETAAYVARSLREMGLEPTEHVGGYGVTALIRGTGEGRCVALRADMDALQITEQTGVSFASENEGVMHACGHDAHTAMLLCAARVLCDLRRRFPGTVKLIFQPSEENSAGSGARRMIEEGVLEDPAVDMIIGQHVWPSAPLGKIALRDGAMMAASDRFFITVRGKSSHGSEPENGVDAIVIACQTVTALQSLVSRTVSPLDSAVVTIGKITGGTRYNIIAEEVSLEGTCRNLSPAVRDALPERMERIVRGVAESMGGSAEFRYVRGYSPTVNSPEGFQLLCDTVRQTLGEDALMIPPSPSLGGEDFSFYGEKVPAVYYRLGCRDMERPYLPLHNSAFLPEWEALPIGARIMACAALRFLRG